MGQGLQEQKQFISLAGGLMSEIVEKLVQPGSVVDSENLYPKEVGQVLSRAGSTQLSAANQATIPDSGTLSDVWRLSTLQGALVRFGVAPTAVHMWAAEPEKWLRPAPDSGGLISYRRGPISVSTTSVLAELPPGANVGSPDVQVSNGIAVVAHDYSNSGSNLIKIELVELSTKAVLNNFSVSGAHTPRVCIVGDIAVVAYVVNTDIVMTSISLDTFAVLANQTLSPCDTGTFLDIRPGGIRTALPETDDVSVIFTSGGDLYLTSVDTTDLTSFETSVVAGTFGNAAPDLGLAWGQDFGVSNLFYIVVADTTNGLYTLWNLTTPAAGTINATATHVLDAGATAVPSGATAGIRNIIASTTGNSSGGLYRVCYEVTAPDAPHHAVIKTACYSGSVTTGTVLRSVGIRSKFWKTSTDLYFLSAFEAQDQNTYFVNAVAFDLTPVSTSSPAALATAYVRGAGGITERLNHPSQVGTGLNGELVIAATYQTRTESIATSGTAIGTTSDIRAVGLVTVQHRTTPDTQLGQCVEFAGSIFTPGSALGVFDGRSYGLAGFPYYPPDIAVNTVAGGNLEPSAAYVYRYLYSFVDHKGRKWRSAPSTFYPVNTTGTDFNFDLTLDTLRLYDRGNSFFAGHQIEVYRTQADAPGAHFLVASIPNDPAQTTVTLNDNVDDTLLGEQLYTDGDGLENQLIPGADHVIQYQNRLFAAQPGTATLWYSLDVDLNHGLLFNEALTFDVGNPDDPITGLAISGSNLVAFKEKSVYILYGNGADALGAGQSYAERLIEPGIGCVNASSILVTDDGAWFEANSTRAGIHRVNGGTVEYIGQGIRKFDNLTITGAVHVPDQSQYRFFSEEGTTLVYNTSPQTWGTNTEQHCLAVVSSYNAVDGVIYAHTDGTIQYENEESRVEGTHEYRARLRSPWLVVGGIEGWERIKKIIGVGTPGDAHTVRVRLYRDFDDTDLIGEFAKDFDGTETKWEWQLRPTVQKLSAIMVEMLINQGVEGPGISGFTMVVGVKRGTKKFKGSGKMLSAAPEPVIIP